MPLLVTFLYIIGISIVFCFRLIPENRVEAYNDIIIMVVCTVTSIQLFQIYRRFDRNDTARYCWLFFGVGVLCEAVGYLIYSIMELLLNRNVEFPNYAEIPIMLGVLFYICSMWLFLVLLDFRSIHPPLSRKIVVNTIFILLTILHIVFYVLPTILDRSETLWMRLLYQIYPTTDLILAYLCLHHALAWLTTGHSAIAQPWMVLVAAFFLFLITDYLYNILILWNLYHPYQWINPGWGLAYLLMSHAAYLQKKLMNDREMSDEGGFSYTDDSPVD